MKKRKTILFAVAAAASIALFSQSCTSKSNEPKGADMKQILTQAIQGIEKLEQDNQTLTSRLEKADKDKVSRENKQLKAKNKELQDQIGKLKGVVAHTELQVESGEENKGRIAELEKEKAALHGQINKLRGVAAHAEMKLEAAQGSIDQIASLEKEKQGLQAQISKLKGLVSYTELQSESKKDQSAQIAALKKRNQKLEKLLKKINAIAQGQKSQTAAPSGK